MLSAIIHKFSCGPLGTNAILFGVGAVGAVIDPSMGSTEKLLRQAELDGLKIEKIFLTHSHWDHIVDAKTLKERTDALLYVHPLDAENVETPGSDGLSAMVRIRGVAPDRFLDDGEIIEVGVLKLEVIHTPGHSPGGVCLYLREQGVLFSGDTLFHKAIGRMDLPTGNRALMQKSLQKLLRLPPDTRVIPGHGADARIEDVKQLYIKYFDSLET